LFPEPVPAAPPQQVRPALAASPPLPPEPPSASSLAATSPTSLPRIETKLPAPAKRSGQSKPAPTRKEPPAPRGALPIDAPEPDPLATDDLATAAIKTAPAWLVSFVFHTGLIILLALLYAVRDVAPTIALDATFAEMLGSQLEDDLRQAASLDPTNVDNPIFSIDPLPADDPLARPPDVEPRLEGLLPADRIPAPSIGLALSGRETGMKQALLAKYGGTATTEAAVARALEWLKRNQRRDGSWSLKGPYNGGAYAENRTAAMAMALLAFQGAGHTHNSGAYQDQVNNGWRALLKLQDQDGNFFQGGEEDHRLYSHAQAMIAVCEIYGMTQDSQFREPAQKAVDYAVKIQAPEGGWRYRPGVDTDTSVTGWFVMGLQSALMAGLDVPSPTLQRVSSYLDTVAVQGGIYYKYQPIRQGFNQAMTAEGLLCRQYLGWAKDDPRLHAGAEFLLENPIDWEQRDVYYWYYATQVLHHLGGQYWEDWNRVMRDLLPSNQVKSGAEEGSWEPNGDQWSSHGGRLYTTCLSTYMLEVYYRHLPIYAYRMR
jgi:hypothetical protein